MASVHNVRASARESKAPSGSAPARRATVQAVWGDIVGRFVAATLRSRPVKLYLVSPWLAETDHDRIATLLGHARQHRAAVCVVTRPSAVAPERVLSALLERQPSLRILVNDQLHAKLYVCQEQDGRGVALIGSANLTAGGARQAEAGILLRPLAGSHLLDDLASVALTGLGGRDHRAAGPVRSRA